MSTTKLPFRPQGAWRYKTARTYVRIDPGQGRFVVNGVPAKDYFKENTRWREAIDPFKAVGLNETRFDIQAHVSGHATRWSKRQPRALAHAIAGALAYRDPSLREQLWRAGFRFKVLPALDWVLKLPPCAWLTPDTDPDELWAQYHELLCGPLPKNWAGDPHVLAFRGRWLLDVLLMPLSDDDLKRVQKHLAVQGQAVSDVDILKELFGITPRDDAFYRWRFTLSYGLHQKAQELGVEFVGAGQDWRWALETAPIEKPARHHRLPGTEGLPTAYVTAEQVANELTGDDEPLDVPAEEPRGEWKPTRQTWEYVLTYYDWDNGVLPYNCHAREMIPPLSGDQRRAVLRFVAEQVDDKPFEVALCAHSRAPWLQGMGLKDFFVGYLVPGARLWIDRTEEPGLYKIRYRPTAPQHWRLLFFEDGRIRPVVREVKITYEVDPTMLLAEGRYSNIEALDRLDLVDRRTAPKVLSRVFELIGLKDESRGVYCTCFDDLFPLLCITKPYSKAYVQQILYDRRNHPWFYPDEERGPGWFVYDPGKERVVVKPPQPPKPRPTAGVWGEVVKFKGCELATLDQQNPFSILEVTDTHVQIWVGNTGQPRTIGRQEIEAAWRHLISRQELSRIEIHGQYSEFNPAYVAAILAALPGVRHQTDPIRLFYEPSKPPTAVAPHPVEVPDIGIRHVVYPIPFNSTPLLAEIREAVQRQFGPVQPSFPFWIPEKPEQLDEYLMQYIADQDANRFVTPRQVADFMVNLGQPKPGERVADICCGTGIFLVKALRFVKEVYGEDADLELYGADIYDKAVEAARLNLQANGARHFTVVQADSLREQRGIFAQKYDMILGNPPFGGGQVGAFLRRWTGLLNTGGRAVVNVSDGTLANSGSSDQELRQWVVNNFELEAVVSLPRPRDSNLYGAKSNVMFLWDSSVDSYHRAMLVSIGVYEELLLTLQIAYRRNSR